MYLQFYKLREFPFAITCDEKFFYESAIHREALANMMYTIQQRKGMVLVTGEVGAGKTFVGNVLGSRLPSGTMLVRMANPPQSGRQLLRAIASRVGMNVRPTSDKLAMEEDLERHLVRLLERGRLVAVILDEAQDLTPSALEELRLLWNWEHKGSKLLQIVLIAQPELRQRLMEPQWEPLRQRIVLSYHLGPLSAPDTAGYIPHRLKIASADGPAVEFTPDARAEVHEATGGIPRLINVLCDNALLVGYARGVYRIDKPIVAEVLRDMTCWGIQSPDRPPEDMAPKMG